MVTEQVIPPVKVNNEDDAWAFLESLKNDELVVPQSGKAIEFNGWPSYHLYLPDVEEDASLTAPVMKSFVDLQTNIYKSVAMVKHGSADVRKLSDEEKATYELRVVVKRGSTDASIDLTSVLTNLGREAIGLMTPEQLVITVLGMGVLYAGHSAWKLFLQHRLDKRKAELEVQGQTEHLKTIQFASEQETARLKIIEQLIPRVPQLVDIEDGANQSKQALLKAVEVSGRATVMGVDLESSVANELRSKSRRQSVEDTIRGEYRVVSINTSNQEWVTVTLESQESFDEVTATFRDRMLGELQMDVITDAVKLRSNVFVELRVRILEGQIREASILKVNAVQSTEDPVE